MITLRTTTKKNRKKRQYDGFKSVPVPFAVTVALLALAGLLYVWFGCRCEVMGREIRALEAERDALNKQYLNEEYKWTRMKSPLEIEAALAKFNIAMAWPRAEQVIRLGDVDLFQDPSTEDSDVIQFARLERAILHE